MLPSGRTERTPPEIGKLLSKVLVTVSAGDQVTLRERSMGLGLTASEGNWVDTLLSDRFCRRLPPSAIVPQAYRLEKLAELVICWVGSSGSMALRRCTKPLLV